MAAKAGATKTIGNAIGQYATRNREIKAAKEMKEKAAKTAETKQKIVDLKKEIQADKQSLKKLRDEIQVTRRAIEENTYNHTKRVPSEHEISEMPEMYKEIEKLQETIEEKKKLQETIEEKKKDIKINVEKKRKATTKQEISELNKKNIILAQEGRASTISLEKLQSKMKDLEEYQAYKANCEKHSSLKSSITEMSTEIEKLDKTIAKNKKNLRELSIEEYNLLILKEQKSRLQAEMKQLRENAKMKGFSQKEVGELNARILKLDTKINRIENPDGKGTPSPKIKLSNSLNLQSSSKLKK